MGGRGRSPSTAAAELLKDTNALLDKARSDGYITDHAWYLGMGTGVHMLVVRGEMEQLQALMAMPETVAINMRAALVNDAMRYGFFATGDTTDLMMGLFEQLADQLN